MSKSDYPAQMVKAKAKTGPAKPEIFYDAKTSNYWWREQGQFLELTGRQVKIQMMCRGERMDLKNDIGLTSGDEMLAKLEREKFVHYAGPLAGHKVGLLKISSGENVLVTTEVKPVQPGQSEHCPKIEKYLGQLLGPDQTQYFCLWVKLAWESLTRRVFMPGQMLALFGPGGCGKSFLQQIVTEILGGRSADPYPFMVGDTSFNSDLAKAEHLMIEDPKARTSFSARREFGISIKNWTVNAQIRVHAKGREAITMPLFRRLTLSCNDERENMMIMPPLDESLLDKVALLKCGPTVLDDDREKQWWNFVKELPSFVRHCLAQRVPKIWKDQRYGIRAFHNPDLLEALAETTEETRLENFIEEVIFKQPNIREWEGTAMELEREIRNSPFAASAQQFFSFTSACGTYLARLEKKQPDRFKSTKSRGRTTWHIRRHGDGEK